MNHQDTASPTLFRLLAREWSIGTPITSMLYNARQTAVGFALENGNVAIVEVSDEDPPERRIHVSAENGRSTIRPRSKAASPLKLVDLEGGGTLLFGTIGEMDFVACGEAGQLVRISPSGISSRLDLEIPGTITALDHCPARARFACAGGSHVSIFDGITTEVVQQFDQGKQINAIRFSPDGDAIAIAHDLGLTIWPARVGLQKTKDIAFPGQPNAVHWSPDGNWIACPLSDGGFQLSSLRDGRTRALSDYPASVRSIVWNKQANALITSGAFRVAAWSMEAAPMDEVTSGVLETGRAGLVPLSAVSSHPDRNLIAAGYENGFITIVQIGGREELILNSEDHGPVTNLEWSRDGKHIALGTGKDLAALISLPPQMFR